MHTILLILIVLFNRVQNEDTCPDFITCETSEKQNACPEGKFYKEKVKIHNCCPGCVSSKGKDQPCRSSVECMPGLKCENTCVKDDKQACGFYKYYDPMLMKTKYWNPSCLPDGSYAPKQCKGEKMAGKCFCVDKWGKRIFGEEEWVKADNMSCACSRMVDEMEKMELNPTYHCDKQGNFEPLQCNHHVCWCATPTTGIPYTSMVNIGMMFSLPCYKPNTVGAQYYRQCDSVNHILIKAKNLLLNHGTKVTLATLFNCNFDGSYHRVQIVKEKKRCVFIDNSPLTELTTEKINCNCAYDKHVAKLAQIPFMADCESNGNYITRQVWNGKVYCIDEDGFYFSNDPKDC